MVEEKEPVDKFVNEIVLASLYGMSVEDLPKEAMINFCKITVVALSVADVNSAEPELLNLAQAFYRTINPSKNFVSSLIHEELGKYLRPLKERR